MREQYSFQEMVTQFLGRHLPASGVSANTLKAYRDTIKLMLEFAYGTCGITPVKMSIESFTADFVLRFLTWLIETRKCSPRTRNQRLAGIHSFCKYVQFKSPETLVEIGKIMSIRKMRETHKLVPYLTTEEMKIMLAAPNVATKSGRRDLAIMTTLYDSGARVQELSDIRVKDVRLENPALIVLHGKGDKYREVPILKRTQDILRRYIAERTANLPLPVDALYLFGSQRNAKISRWGITHVIKKYERSLHKAGKLNLPFQITLHVFRHTKAMHALKAGVPLIYIRDLLGHNSVTTTEIYARANVDEKRKALENVFVDVGTAKLPDWREDKNLMDWLNSL